MRGAFLTLKKNRHVPDEGSLFELRKRERQVEGENEVCNEAETHSTVSHRVRWPVEVLWKFGFYGGRAAQLQLNCF